MASSSTDPAEPEADVIAAVEASETPAKAEPMPASQPPAAPPPRRSALPAFVALVLGGAIAAGGGFALARFQPDLLSLPQAPNADLQALKDQIAALPAPDTTLPDRLKAIETTLAQLSDRIASVESRPAGAADPALADQLKALQDRVAALNSGTAQPEAIAQAVAAAEDRLKQAEARAAELAAQAEATAQATRRTAALDRVAAALDSGAPFAAALSDLPDLPPALADHAATGLPTVAALRETFPPAARAALEAALRANMGESWTDRVTSFLRSQTGLRSLTPREGDDPDAILSRAEAALAKGDLSAALSELGALPETAKPPLAAWTADAQLRLAAEAALAQIAGAK